MQWMKPAKHGRHAGTSLKRDPPSTTPMTPALGMLVPALDVAGAAQPAEAVAAVRATDIGIRSATQATGPALAADELAAIAATTASIPGFIYAGADGNGSRAQMTVAPQTIVAPTAQRPGSRVIQRKRDTPLEPSSDDEASASPSCSQVSVDSPAAQQRKGGHMTKRNQWRHKKQPKVCR